MYKEHASSCKEAAISVPAGSWTREDSQVPHSLLSRAGSLRRLGIVSGYRVTTLTHHLGCMDVSSHLK